MKRIFFTAAALLCGLAAGAQDIPLPKPDMKQSSKTMVETLRMRHSVRQFEETPLSMEEISTLCWAACGLSRDDNHITSPTAMNRQEIRLFVFFSEGVYEYLPRKNALVFVAKEDARHLFVSNAPAPAKGKKGKKNKQAEPDPKAAAFGQPFVLDAPVTLLMVIDLDKFGSNDERARTMGYIDAGIVSENINLYCESVKLGTVPRVTMDVPALKKLLKLNDNQIPAINNPVGRPLE